MISLQVKDVYSKEMHSLIVGKDTPVEEVIKSFVEKPELRGIIVVDEKKQFAGVITRRDLVTWAKFMVGVPQAKNVEEISESIRVLSKTAEGLISKETKNAAVALEDNINVVLDKMISLDLIDVPVVNGKEKVVGDIQLLNILKAILEKNEKPIKSLQL
ncbi:MAG: CBS domain-containing protein [Candidatus Jordarchaeaceae archaeon]